VILAGSFRETGQFQDTLDVQPGFGSESVPGADARAMAELDPRMPSDLAATERFDVFISFTRKDAVGRELVPEIMRALTEAGLRVFLDERIDEFAGITEALAAALAASRVLLAYYSSEFPRRYACQWELTAAFIAAQRDGDPRERVLVINPDPEGDHVRPVELADAKFFPEPVTPENMRHLVRRVREQVAKAPGPFGRPRPPVDPARLPARVLRPRQVIGRYPQLWEIHSALHRMDFPPMFEVQVRPAVLVSGLAGVGKTSLAEQYAYLYRDAFPGGVLWAGPFGDHAPEDFLPQYQLALPAVAEKVIGPVPGVAGDELRGLLADHFAREGQRVLWIVDSVPPDLPRYVLDRLLIPAPQVRTVLTSRSPSPGWDAAALELSGLTPDEGLRLFLATRGANDEGERAAIRKFVERCGGHPFAIRGVANSLLRRPNALTDRDLESYPDDALSAIRAGLGRLSEHALAVLGVASVLAAAPFPPSLVAEAQGQADWRPTLQAVADELAESSFLDQVGDDWQVHDLVSAAVRLDRPAADTVVARAAQALLNHKGHQHFVEHATALARRPTAHRIRLLRPVAEAFARRGDVTSAGELYAEIVASEVDSVEDLVALARVEIAGGLYGEAVAHARRASALAPGDHRPRLLAAQALDCQGRYAEADREFWNEPARDDLEVAVATAVARRLRGRPKESVAILEPVLVELRAAPPGSLRENVLPAAKLEYARALQLTGKARAARAVAGEVIDSYREAGLERHARFAEAEMILAEASLTLDLLELNPDQNGWVAAEVRLRELRNRYEVQYGPDNPLTLTAAVNADRALIALGDPKRALAALGATEEHVARVLGTEHLLWFRLRHAIGQGHAQLYEFARQAEVLEPLVPMMIPLLGTGHPLTVEVQLDLGIALVIAEIEPRRRAIELIDTAAAQLKETLGANVDLSGKAFMAKGVLRLPAPAIRGLMLAGKLFWPTKK
jgi:Flp pilus assembly protein TadD